MRARVGKVISSVLFGLLFSACSGGLSEEDAADLQSQVEEAAAANGTLSAELEATSAEAARLGELASALESELESAKGAVGEAEARAAAAEGVAADASATNTDLAGEIADAKSEVRGLEGERDQLEQSIAALLLAYDGEINSSLERAAKVAEQFACEWGTQLATDGRRSADATANATHRAFIGSSEHSDLVSDPEIAAAIDIAQALDTYAFAGSQEALAEVAVECWQKEDAKLNAALYVHQEVLREAVLDAACTTGYSDAYKDTYDAGYTETAVYLDWELRLGRDDARDYMAAVEDRFGSLKELLAIPDETLKAADERCADIRDLIEPKGGRTWNVGDEIMPGTWKAFDVSDCYWARLSENGDIKANHFGDALRISVNVRESDGQFEISRCDFYYANP